MTPDRSKTNTDEEDYEIVRNYVTPVCWLNNMMDDHHVQAKWIRAAMFRAVTSVENSHGIER